MLVCICCLLGFVVGLITFCLCLRCFVGLVFCVVACFGVGSLLVAFGCALFVLLFALHFGFVGWLLV